MLPTNILNLFGLPNNFTEEELKKKFSTLVKKHHPDVGGNPETFRQIVEAYEVLSNLPPSIKTFRAKVYMSPKELKDYLGENILIEIDKYHFEIFVPYETRVGDTIKIENILPNLTLLVTIKDKNEQPT
jgi:curved DNA-binding protein CbpA